MKAVFFYPVAYQRFLRAQGSPGDLRPSVLELGVVADVEVSTGDDLVVGVEW